MTSEEALRHGTSLLASRSLPSARRDTELLLITVLGITRAALFAHPESVLSPQQLTTFEDWLEKRSHHYPIQYLRGTQEFFGRDFRVTPDVLIPRPETEILVECALDQLAARSGDPLLQVLDIGTGSGCIGISLACADPRVRVTATDISSEALKVALRNARELGCADQIRLLRCAGLQGIQPTPFWHLVVSNPPYISSERKEDVDPAVRLYEPAAALYPGPTGLEIYEKLFREAIPRLGTGGCLLLEIGAGQLNQVSRLAARSEWKLKEVRRDLAGLDRCARFERLKK